MKDAARRPMSHLRWTCVLGRLPHAGPGQGPSLRAAPKYAECVSGDRLRAAAELEALTPDERDAAVRAGFVTDPTAVPADLLARARRKADARIAATESADSKR